MWKHHYQFLTLLFHDFGQRRPLTWWYWRFPLKSTQETQLKSLIALSKRNNTQQNILGEKHSKIFIKVSPGANSFFSFQISEFFFFLIIHWNVYVQVNCMAYIKKFISINLIFFPALSQSFLFSKKCMDLALNIIKL